MIKGWETKSVYRDIINLNTADVGCNTSTHLKNTLWQILITNSFPILIKFLLSKCHLHLPSLEYRELLREPWVSFFQGILPNDRVNAMLLLKSAMPKYIDQSLKLAQVPEICSSEAFLVLNTFYCLPSEYVSLLINTRKGNTNIIKDFYPIPAVECFNRKWG